MLIKIIDVIQPKWEIEEYVIINCKLVWLSAIILPINVDNIEIIIIKVKLELTKLSINKGANFCHVSNINRILHDICFLILGNQKCIGAPPSLSTKDKRIKLVTILLNMVYHDKL